MYASSFGHLELAKTLLREGADPNSAMSNGNNALILAANRGHAQVVRVLAQGGADVNVRFNPAKDGSTPLIMASMNGHGECVRELVSSGANLHAVANAGYNAIQIAVALEHPAVVRILAPLVNLSKMPGSSSHPLMYAVLKSNLEIIRDLIRAGWIYI